MKKLPIPILIPSVSRPQHHLRRSYASAAQIEFQLRLTRPVLTNRTTSYVMTCMSMAYHWRRRGSEETILRRSIGRAHLSMGVKLPRAIMGCNHSALVAIVERKRMGFAAADRSRSTTRLLLAVQFKTDMDLKIHAFRSFRATRRVDIYSSTGEEP